MKHCNPDRVRQARRGVTTFIALSMAIHLAIVLSVEFSLRLRDPLYGDKAAKLYRRIQAEKPDATIVVLGSSRTGMGFHGQLVESIFRTRTNRKIVAFNFGIPAAGPISQLVNLRRFLKQGIRPDLLVVELLPALLHGKNAPIESRGIKPEMVQRAELDTLIEFGYPAESNSSAWHENRYFPWNRMHHQLTARVLPNMVPAAQRYDWSRKCDPSGWNPTPFTNIGAERRRELTAAAIADYGAYLPDLVIEGGPKRAFETMLSLARENGIPVAILWMPEGTEFRRLYAAATLRELDGLFQRWHEEFACEIINAQMWVPDGEFMDSHHLLQAGAVRFSDRLTGEYLIRLLREFDRVAGRMPPSETRISPTLTTRDVSYSTETGR